MTRLRILAATVVVGILTTACDDPGGVGIELIGSDGGRPATHDAPTPASPDSVTDIPGNAVRVLMGTVSDPLLGDMEAVGYIDFDDESIQDDMVLVVELDLVFDYAYGDTTSQVLFSLSDMDEDWEALAPSDTTLESGKEREIFSAMGSSGRVAVRLPQDWVDEKQDILRDPDFRTLFNGFEIRALSGNAVLGLNADASLMRMHTESDTLPFPINKNTTTLKRQATGTIPEGSLMVQDGFGDAVRLDVDFTDVPLGAVNRAILSVPLDSLGIQASAPPHFVRPLIDVVDLIAVLDDGTVVTTVRASATRNGDELLLESLFLVQDIQDMLLGDSPISHFLLAARKGTVQIDPPPFAPAENAISVLLLSDEEDMSARFILTVTSPE
jgi:hypothetical protein